MHLLCIGLNHQTAGVGLRERVAFCESGLKASLARLQCGGQAPETIREMVILSTCNRVEVYATVSELDFAPLEDFLSEVRQVPDEELSKHLYRYENQEAVAHLFRVAAGLDSLVLGEAQILGQVAQALELARGQNTTGPLLSRLFQSAIHAGKRARTETQIGQNAASVSSLAVRLAAQVTPELSQTCVAVLGAGETAELTVEALRKRGVTRIQVVNRTLERARQLAERWNAAAATFEMLPEVLAQADILISSTSAPHTLIQAELVAEIMAGRPTRPLVLIDIAVPRDVEPQAGMLPGVTLYDLDTLHERLEHSLAERRSAVPQVEQILSEEQAIFMEYMASLDLLPLIVEITRQAEDLRRAELEKTFRRLPDLGEEERRRIEALTTALVKKLLHTPLGRLRCEASGPSAASYAALARSLYGLGDMPCEIDRL